MNPDYDRIIAADAEIRAGLFTQTAQRIGTTPQNAEKDFWVCWTLDALFNGIEDRPRLLFKGGTSLSKGFDLIRRFSEDIDVTVFRDDLGKAASIKELQALSGKKRQVMLEAIKGSCETYINGPLLRDLAAIFAETAARTGLSSDALAVVPNPDDSQSLLVQYPTATPTDGYMNKQVKIESGAKSALDLNSEKLIRPYLEQDVPGADLSVANITTVDAERTFWDKVVILHGIRRWYERRGTVRSGGNRLSRHYYDMHMLLTSEHGQRALGDVALGADCVAHARMFFNRPDFDLASAKSSSFALLPEGDLYDILRRDYVAMTGMIFGEAPPFEMVIESVTKIQNRLNA